jgi:hypothetical protein
VERILLNHKPVLAFGPLDQGFWPDGIYTAPCEEALKYDIQQMKAFGFNMVRKHIKVEPARWYYWTDRLGLMVWQDMPSANSYLGPMKQAAPPVDQPEFEGELRRMVQTHWNVPSIVLWTVFNEGQGQFDTPQLVDMVKKLDPTRLVNQASGGRYFDAGDINDFHSYPEPDVREPVSGEVQVCGEFGGISYFVNGHTWSDKGHGYITVNSPEQLLDLYADYADQVKTLADTKGLCGAVYTQLTDVEKEINGLMTYDRIPKVDPAQIARATHFEIPPPTYETILPSSESAPQSWKYTTTPPAGNWNTPQYDDSAWSSGQAPFGNVHSRTPWQTKEIWLRRQFKAGPLTPQQIAHLVLSDFQAGNVQAYLNGLPIYSHAHATPDYRYRAIGPESGKAIIPDGTNLIAVHCLHQGGKEQYVDEGLSVRTPGH